MDIEARVDDECNSVISSFSSISLDPPKSRIVCEKCRRPVKTCWCSSLPREPLHVTTTVYILQHPYEETRNLQTGLMLKLGLESNKCHILKGRRFSLTRHMELAAAVTDPYTLLMWPGPSADNLQDYIADETRPDLRCVCHTLIILDGTWHQARAMYSQNSFLHHIKQLLFIINNGVPESVDPAEVIGCLSIDSIDSCDLVQLTNTGLSNYVVRTQPSDACLSTVETVAIAIEILENRPDVYEILMRPLRALCDYQLEHGAVVHHSKQHLIDNGLYVKQLPKPTDKKRQNRRRPRHRAGESGHVGTDAGLGDISTSTDNVIDGKEQSNTNLVLQV